MKLHTIAENMGAREYTPPSDPRQLMADFYTVQLLKSRPAGAPSHRNDGLEHEVQYVRGLLVPYLREHLLDKAGYSISSEMAHAFDMANVADEPTMDRAEGVSRVLRKLGLSDGVVYTLHRWSTAKTSFNFNMQDKLAIAKAGLSAFRPGYDGVSPFNWPWSYGGEPWVSACKSWLDLYKASSLNDAEVYIDKLYSTEHNTGCLLNKNSGYKGKWLRTFLDLKFVANEPEQLAAHASPYVKRLAKYVLPVNYGRAWDSSMEVEIDDYKKVLNKFNKFFEQLANVNDLNLSHVAGGIGNAPIPCVLAMSQWPGDDFGSERTAIIILTKDGDGEHFEVRVGLYNRRPMSSGSAMPSGHVHNDWAVFGDNGLAGIARTCIDWLGS